MNRLSPFLSVVLTAPLLLLGSCGVLDRVLESPEPTLADLQPVELPADQQELPQVSLEELRQIYQDVLARQQDPAIRLRLLHRLADIEMLGAEAKLANAEDQEAFFAQAIAAYESLLRENPEYHLQDQMLYQLSKAYDLSGQSDASQAVLERLSTSAQQSPHLPEANFRRAERYFVEADYARAEATYADVISYGPDTPYYTRALYMQGWSRFKQDRYAQSIEAFTASLDQLLLQGQSLDSLTRGERELVQDSLRVLAIVFSNLDGMQTIAGVYEELGVRPYQHLLYEALGELYLSQERYRDSADTYKAYTEHFPDSGLAHIFQMRVIEAYEAGGFRELILTAKQDYVAAFTVSADYWRNSDQASQEQMAERLRMFIEELASHYHALAQTAQKSTPQDALASGYYAQAAHYYHLYLDSFPENPEVPRLAFLLAESLFEAEDYPAAIAAYERVAYVHVDDARAGDAAYTAILAYEKLTAKAHSTEPSTEYSALRRQRIDAELRFYANFPEDARALPVVGHATTALFQDKDYTAALAAAAELTDRTPPPTLEILIPAWLVSGHSHFEMQQYVAAEQAYQDGLALMSPGEQRYADTMERLAAAIYRQAEEEVAREQHLAAAEQFHRVIATAPTSAVRINAQYDAAAAYIRAGELERANTQLLDFRQRYPAHALTAGIGATLLQNYEQMEQWREAATELDTMHTVQSGDDISRQTLLVAAQYYEKVGDTETAVARYSSYAQNWPRPFDEYLEVMNRLTELHRDTGEIDNQRYWLNQISQAHDSAGEEQSARSLYLAASSASIIADNAYTEFLSLKLTQPIKRSLPAKKKAMEHALAAYDKCNTYAVEEFSTLSSYRVAHIYQRLSSDLIESERPPKLDTLALEQYEILLEEQAFPFEEKAIAIHEANAQRSWQGVYDEWVKKSFIALAQLLPARYRKLEASSFQQLATLQDIPKQTSSRKVRVLNIEGIAQREQGNFEDSEEAYLAALSVAEDHALTHRNIGILYDLYLGQPHRALHHYGRYQTLTEGSDRAVTGWIADLEHRKVSLAAEVM